MVDFGTEIFVAYRTMGVMSEYLEPFLKLANVTF